MASQAARAAGLLGVAAALVAVCFASIAYGSLKIPPGDVIDAFTSFRDVDEHVIVRDVRVPRTLIGLVVGAALGVAGAVMQGMTRNPLADPAILGIQAGAAFAVVIAIFVLGVGSVGGYAWFALAGAAAAGVVVYALGSAGGSRATPINLALGSPEMDLRAENLTLAYDKAAVVEQLDLEILTGKITAVVGANACGKSTLLRGLARLLKPRGGAVLLDGESITKLPTRAVARRIGLLPQAPVAPDGLTVEDLVARGRYPHQRLLSQWSREDREQVDWALKATGTLDQRERPVEELSGGQRQRAWVAKALAQDTEMLLLDEPTTYLDLAHQVEMLDLLEELNERDGRTIVLVLHDLNQASRYAHRIVAMAGGRIHSQGPPSEIVNAKMVRTVYGIEAEIVPHPVEGTPLCLPLGKRGQTP